MRCIIGIDTSNYTTSLCMIDVDKGQVLADERRVLPVRDGGRGLRQSEALFFHVRHLPVLMDQLMGRVRYVNRDAAVTAIGVSTRPRPFAKSYMPVFVAGVSFAESLGRVLGVPVVRTSHQEGHIAAATRHLESSQSSPFLAVHLSGGTSDVVIAKETAWGYKIEMVGEGADLHAGQFIDRVGVALGCPFPAGPALERMAEAYQTGDGNVNIPSRVLGSSMSFSGPCTAALRAIEGGAAPEAVAAGVQSAVANSVAKAIVHAVAGRPEVEACVVAGGVAENLFIRARITLRVHRELPRLRIEFAPTRLSSDNAFGVASLAWRHWCRSVL